MIPGPDELSAFQHECERAFDAAIESTGLAIGGRKVSRMQFRGTSIVSIVVQVENVPMIASIGRDAMSVTTDVGTDIQFGMVDYSSVEDLCRDMTRAVVAEAIRLRDGIPAPPRRPPPPLPTPVRLSATVRAQVTEQYPSPNDQAAISLLEHTRLGIYDYSSAERDAILQAILRIANGKMDSLRRLALDPRDYRDLLVGARLLESNSGRDSQP